MSFTDMEHFRSYYLTPSLHLLHHSLLPSFILTHRPEPCSSGLSHVYSAIMLLCHHSLQTSSFSLTPPLTEFTDISSLSPPLLLSSSLLLSLSFSHPLPSIPFRGKSILLGSGSKSCSSEHLVCLGWLVWEGQEVVIKSRASCTTDRIQAE